MKNEEKYFSSLIFPFSFDVYGKHLKKHLHANRNQDNPGDDFGNLRLEALGGVSSDFVADNAHDKACKCDCACGKYHVHVHERKRNPDRESVDACRNREQQNVCDSQILGCYLFAFFFTRVTAYGAPNHAPAQNAKNRAGDGRADGAEPALSKVAEEKSEQSHAALENSKTHRLEHGAAILDSGLRKSRGDRDREAVHSLNNRDNDNFYDTHSYMSCPRRRKFFHLTLQNTKIKNIL